ncbi:MAG: ABC transporter substrate-binding protein [Chloroflexota bacterium]
MGVLSLVSDAGNWIALARGYFRDEGLAVEPHHFASAAQMIAPLGTDQIDVGGGAPSVGLNNAVARGVDIRIVADKGNTSPGHGFVAIMARKDLYDSGAIRGPAGLKGRKYAITTVTGIPSERVLNKYMGTVGLKARDVDLVQMDFPEMAAAFHNKSIDAGQVGEPFVTKLVAEGDGIVLVREDQISPGDQIAVILYSGGFIKQHQDTARQFMLAYLRGVRFYNDAFSGKHPGKRREAIAILAKYTPVKDPTLYDRMMMPGLNPNGEVNVGSLKKDQDYFIQAGLQHQRIDLNRVVDMSFARLAVKRLGPYQ